MNDKLIALLAGLGIALGATLPTNLALADDNGIAEVIHDLRREGRKICQDGHFHSGTSAGEVSKKVAMGQAIDSWQSFTAMEYGTDWAHFRYAGSKSAKCSASSSGWGCEVNARPCKPIYKLRRVKHRK